MRRFGMDFQTNILNCSVPATEQKKKATQATGGLLYNNLDGLRLGDLILLCALGGVGVVE